MAAFTERVKRPPRIMERLKYNRTLFFGPSPELAVIHELPSLEEQEEVEREMTETERKEGHGIFRRLSGIFRPPWEGLIVRRSISHSSDRDRRSHRLSFQGEKVRGAMSDLLLTADGRDRVDGIPQELRKQSLQDLRLLGRDSHQADQETSSAAPPSVNTNRSGNPGKDDVSLDSQPVHMISHHRYPMYRRPYLPRPANRRFSDEGYDIGPPNSSFPLLYAGDSSSMESGDNFGRRSQKWGQTGRMKSSTLGGRINVVDIKEPPLKLSKRSILLFRELVAVVMVTVITWCPLGIYVTLQRSKGMQSYEMFASPVHATLHVIAWTRPFFLAAIHLCYRNLY